MKRGAVSYPVVTERCQGCWHLYGRCQVACRCGVLGAVAAGHRGRDRRRRAGPGASAGTGGHGAVPELRGAVWAGVWLSPADGGRRAGGRATGGGPCAAAGVSRAGLSAHLPRAGVWGAGAVPATHGPSDQASQGRGQGVGGPGRGSFAGGTCGGRLVAHRPADPAAYPAAHRANTPSGRRRRLRSVPAPPLCHRVHRCRGPRADRRAARPHGRHAGSMVTRSSGRRSRLP
jgi:hypothetical protein